jgi:hypothetical protein
MCSGFVGSVAMDGDCWTAVFVVICSFSTPSVAGTTLDSINRGSSRSILTGADCGPYVDGRLPIPTLPDFRSMKLWSQCDKVLPDKTGITLSESAMAVISLPG